MVGKARLSSCRNCKQSSTRTRLCLLRLSCESLFALILAVESHDFQKSVQGEPIELWSSVNTAWYLEVMSIPQHNDRFVD